MADNPQVRAGTAGGTITVAADEITSPYSGDTAQAQAVKILDGSVNGTTPAKVTSSGELVTFVGNQGTVTVGGTAAMLVTGGTVVVSSAPTTTVQATNLDIRDLTSASDSVAAAQSGAWNVGGTVQVAGTVPVSGTVGVSGTVPVAVTNSGTVTVTGTPTVDTELTTADLDTGAGTDTRAVVGLARAESGGAILVGSANPLPVFSANGGTVVVSSITSGLPAGTNAIGKLAANSGVDIGDVDVTSVPADPFGTNSDAAVSAGATGSIQAKLRRISSDIDAIKTAVETIDNVVAGSEAQVDVVTMPTTTVQATNLDIRDLTSASDSVAAAQSGAWNVGGTVNAVQSGSWNTGGTITKGSAVMGLGYVLGGTQITLTASGTIIAAVASKTIYVTHEAFTVQGGTVTITARNGNGGGTLWGPMQFSPTGGMAVSAPLEQGGLYQTISGSAVYYELVGSGTVGGRIRWAVA